ncbi:MAG: C25 family cysteine peptidase [Candidatus Thermoplasmatota archaeon]
MISYKINPYNLNRCRKHNTIIPIILVIMISILNPFSTSITAESDKETIGIDHYDLLIITPSEFVSNLQPLLKHKENYTIKTRITTLDEIYLNYTGRDNAEKIKYYIKYAIEHYNIQYVLLVGDITRLPIRKTYATPGWDNEEDILSDLYYADIYDANGSFCSWDSNNNSRFGEVVFPDNIRSPTQITDIDGVDLYPDVALGRLACTSKEEVDIIVSKIITYETITYNQNWFKKIILAGGDTFPVSKSLRFFIYEGEITNVKVAQQLPDFTPIYLWASKRNLNAYTFNKAINNGAGFLSYSGHGFEHGWGTYKPNAIRNKMGFTQPLYYTPFIKLLRNDHKLPIVFFDACLTAKLDFNISSFYKYYPLSTTIFLMFTHRTYNKSQYFPCFAWSFIIHDKGGAIASVGSTRTAYTHVDKDGVYAGAGYLNVHFFKSYHEGVKLGEMMKQAQIDYINNVGRDYFTLEEFILLGDPSLMVGGYP